MYLNGNHSPAGNIRRRILAETMNKNRKAYDERDNVKYYESQSHTKTTLAI